MSEAMPKPLVTLSEAEQARLNQVAAILRHEMMLANAAGDVPEENPVLWATRALQIHQALDQALDPGIFWV